eukprot:5927255-Amphidinium_carterae.1
MIHPRTGKRVDTVMVSSKGRVLLQGRTTFGTLLNSGYRCAGVARTVHLVHRLVLASFMESRPAFDWEVNHKDGDKQNNSLENLEFATRSENMLHSHHHHQKATRNKRA